LTELRKSISNKRKKEINKKNLPTRTRAQQQQQQQKKSN
jgi:hypothetical protein